MTAEETESNERLLRRLEEAEQTLAAIREGAVDAVVVEGPSGPQVYTLESPDQPFRTLVESMQEGAITLSEEGTILYANGMFSSLLGRAPSDVIGQRLLSLVSAEYEYTAADLLRQGLVGTTKGTLRLRGKGENILVQLTLSPLDHGPLVTCCGVVFDLRDRERIERAHAAQQAAEQANAAKDRFLAVLSHELRSPLNTVLGWAQILNQRADLDPAIRRAVQTIERSARAQAQMIADLLDISRIVAKKLHLEQEVVDLKTVVEAALGAAALSRPDRPIEITSSLPELDASISGDSTRLQQVVTNLLNNAVKFTKPGDKIHVSLEEQGPDVVLSVSDTGIGISIDQLPHVFDPFRQASLDPRDRKGGLGLGLAIAKQLVEAHGGSIVAESEGPGTGSRFRVRLPRAPSAPLSTSDGSGIVAELSALEILVVDDEPDTLELTRYVLETAGARVQTADSAGAALGLIAARRFDLLVSDIGLPGQDGHALLREVRARGFGPRELPALALTGFASSSDAMLCAAAGFQQHLAKPVDARELVRTLARLASERVPRIA